MRSWAAGRLKVDNGGGVMAVSVSRRIEAPAKTIFGVLADPGRHTEIDGSGMLRGAVTSDVITGAGDVFVMKMYFERLGDYQMNNRVVVFEQDRLIGWEPAAGDGHPDESSGGWGHRWTFSLVPYGPDATVVTESYDCSRVPAEEQANMDGGRVWLDDMARTLELLAKACR
jgi:hypothetical protein